MVLPLVLIALLQLLPPLLPLVMIAMVPLPLPLPLSLSPPPPPRRAVLGMLLVAARS